MGSFSTGRDALRITRLPDGTQTLEIKLDALAEPDNNYYADWYAAALDQRVAHFTFGKLSVTGKHLTTVLEITMPQAGLPALRRTLRRDGSGKHDFTAKLEEFVQAHHLSVGGHGGASSLVTPATKEHAMAANFATLGYSDTDAVACFFRLPPTAKLTSLSPEVLSQLRIEGVVRIDTTSSILLSFCRDVIQFSQKEPPNSDDENEDA